MDLSISSAGVVGNVYNLKQVSDIAGIDVTAQAGVVLAAGGRVTMQNRNDVLVKHKGTQAGLALALRPAGATI